MDSDLLDTLAGVAHELWKRQVEADGWRAGKVFDPASRSHDALRPFAQLSEYDRRHTRVGVECLELEDLLRGAIRYQRGPSREFTLAEMRVGRPVELTGPHGEGGVTDRGTIESWSVGRDGELELIRVRFGDGITVEYAAAECELKRPEEHGPTSGAPAAE